MQVNNLTQHNNDKGSDFEFCGVNYVNITHVKLSTSSHRPAYISMGYSDSDPSPKFIDDKAQEVYEILKTQLSSTSIAFSSVDSD